MYKDQSGDCYVDLGLEAYLLTVLCFNFFVFPFFW